MKTGIRFLQIFGILWFAPVAVYDLFNAKHYAEIVSSWNERVGQGKAVRFHAGKGSSEYYDVEIDFRGDEKTKVIVNMVPGYAWDGPVGWAPRTITVFQNPHDASEYVINPAAYIARYNRLFQIGSAIWLVCVLTIIAPALIKNRKEKRAGQVNSA